jgi:hypothetical protein
MRASRFSFRSNLIDRYGLKCFVQLLRAKAVGRHEKKETK